MLTGLVVEVDLGGFLEELVFQGKVGEAEVVREGQGRLRGEVGQGFDLQSWG